MDFQTEIINHHVNDDDYDDNDDNYGDFDDDGWLHGWPWIFKLKINIIDHEENHCDNHSDDDDDNLVMTLTLRLSSARVCFDFTPGLHVRWIT